MLRYQGAHTTSETAELFDVARSTVYRAIQRADATIVAGLQPEQGSGITVQAVREPRAASEGFEIH